MERWFDCINVFLNETTCMQHTQWLRKKPFLKYLDDWKADIQSRKGFNKAEQRMMHLSSETSDGLKMISKDILKIWVLHCYFILQPYLSLSCWNIYSQ